MKKRRIYLNITLIILLLALIIIFWQPLFSFFQNQDRVVNFIKQFGMLAPLAFIFLQTIQIILAPVPGQLTTFLGGFIFGYFWGIIYSLVGLAIGSFLAFLIGRKLGRPVVRYFVQKETIKKFDNVIKSKNSLFIIFLFFLLPFFPDDAICFLAGLTKIPLLILLLMAVLGRLPTIIITVLFGSQFKSFSFEIILIYFIMFIIFTILFFVFRKQIEKYLLIKK